MRTATPRSRPGMPSAPAPNDVAGLPELTFPAFKPPFEVGKTIARPKGEVWVLRSRAANDLRPLILALFGCRALLYLAADARRWRTWTRAATA